MGVLKLLFRLFWVVCLIVLCIFIGSLGRGRLEGFYNRLLSRDEPQSRSAAVKLVDMEVLMSQSQPGMVLSQYRTQYDKIVDTAIAELEAQKPGATAEQVRELASDQRYLTSEKVSCAQETRRILAELVRRVMSNEDDGTILLDKDSVLKGTASADVTPIVISKLKTVIPQVPPLPEITVNKLQPAEPAPTSSPATSATDEAGAKPTVSKSQRGRSGKR